MKKKAEEETQNSVRGDIYKELEKVHNDKFNEMSVGQFITGLIEWAIFRLKLDLYFVDDEKMIDLLGEYVRDYDGNFS